MMLHERLATLLGHEVTVEARGEQVDYIYDGVLRLASQGSITLAHARPQHGEGILPRTILFEIDAFDSILFHQVQVAVDQAIDFLGENDDPHQDLLGMWAILNASTAGSAAAGEIREVGRDYLIISRTDRGGRGLPLLINARNLIVCSKKATRGRDPIVLSLYHPRPELVLDQSRDPWSISNSSKDVADPPSEKCDLCGKTADAIIDGMTDGFADGPLKPYSPWACMCPDCHKLHGCGLEVGFGQKYERKADGRFHMAQAW